jgi:hypothetical protein
MGSSSEMPPEVRRAAWEALWRILLSPPSNQDPGAEPADSETQVPPQGRHPDSFLGDAGQ